MFEAESSKALRESVRSIEDAERRVEAALALAKEAEEEVCTPDDLTLPHSTTGSSAVWAISNVWHVSPKGWHPRINSVPL